MRAKRLGFLGLSALLGLGCAASAELRAAPERVCAGRGVRLNWQGSGSGRLSAEPADASLGDVPESGMKLVRPRESTTYRLTVSSLLGSASSEARVAVVAAPEKPTPVSAPTSDAGAGCSPKALWVTARVAPDAWDPHLRVATVASADGRTYTVDHALVRAEVVPGDASESFRDLPVAGAWRLESPLGPGESCGGAQPAALSVDVTFVCAE
ncbi:MAG TPA: hypothetical protein VMR31_02675 [Myxococcota bacterium]|nr:hypothetical protein [Myxococcota bacterium]